MSPLTFAGVTGLLTIFLIACSGFAPFAAPTAVPETATPVAQVSIQEKLAALEESIDEDVAEFSLDVASNAARMLQHTIWVLADEDAIKEKLAENGYELVGDVV